MTLLRFILMVFDGWGFMSEIILIGDKKVREVLVQESNEPIVDLFKNSLRSSRSTSIDITFKNNRSRSLIHNISKYFVRFS